MAKFQTRSGIVHLMSEDDKNIFITTYGSLGAVGTPSGISWSQRTKAECIRKLGKKAVDEERRIFEAEYKYNSDIRLTPEMIAYDNEKKRQDEEREYKIRNNMPLPVDAVFHKIYTQKLITSGVLKCGCRYFIYKTNVSKRSVEWEIQLTPEEREARKFGHSHMESGTSLYSIAECFEHIMRRGFSFENPDNLPMVLPDKYIPPEKTILKPFSVADNVLNRMVNIAEQTALDNEDKPDGEDIRRIYRLLNAVKMGKEIRIIHTPHERTAL